MSRRMGVTLVLESNILFFLFLHFLKKERRFYCLLWLADFRKRSWRVQWMFLTLQTCIWKMLMKKPGLVNVAGKIKKKNRKVSSYPIPFLPYYNPYRTNIVLFKILGILINNPDQHMVYSPEQADTCTVWVKQEYSFLFLFIENWDLPSLRIQNVLTVSHHAALAKPKAKPRSQEMHIIVERI